MNLQMTDVPLPVRFVYETPLTEGELLQFSEGNEVVWIERESDGALDVKPKWTPIEGGMRADISVDRPDHPMSDDEFVRFCADNELCFAKMQSA